MGLPKILVGGVLIIDLSTLSITPSVDMETYTTISNSEILSQLAKLKQYIGNPTAQKPLWVRMSYDGEMITTMGALYKEDGDPHFKLVIKVMDYRLVIDVTFTQDEETLEWYIDTGDAKYLFTSNSQEVDSYIADSISSGAIKSALDLKANLSGADFTGAITSPSIIENMSGYSISLQEITNLTIENVYSGIVKNGNKLTLVFALNLTKEDNLSGSQPFVFVTIPETVGSKIYPTTIGSYLAVQFFEASIVYGTSTLANIKILVEKQSSTRLKFYLQGDTINSLPLNQKAYLRIESTYLLSDNLAE